MGKQVVALITDMDQPLGLRVGNSLEVAEVLGILRGEGPNDLRELCLELAGWMFHLGGQAETVAQGKRTAGQLLASGKALAKFTEMVELQGGDPGVIDDPGGLPQARHAQDVISPRSGYITAINCEAVGTACVLLGGGREKKEDSVDPAVGLSLRKKVGDQVAAGEALCSIHFNSEFHATRAKKLIADSYRIGDTPPAERRRLVQRVITRLGEKS